MTRNFHILGIPFLLLSFALGCGAGRHDWSPARSIVAANKQEIPIDLPARGIPALILEAPDAQRNTPPTFAVVDTGASVTLATPAWANRHSLPLRRESGLRMTDAFDQTASTPLLARVKSLKVGAATFESFDVVVDELPTMQAMSKRLEVVLGRPLFADVLLTIDYPRHKLMIERGDLPAPNGRDVLEMRRDAHGNLLVPAKIQNEIAWLILDTGVTGDGILLSRFRLLGIRWTSPPVDGEETRGFIGSARQRFGRMNGQIAIGQYTLNRPIVSIAFNDDREFLGADVLRHFVVTIDQRNNRVRFTRPTTQPIEVPSVQRFGFRFATNEGNVTVDANSSAQTAGLQNGDRVLSIDGIPLERLSHDRFESLERHGNAVMLRVERGGKVLSIRVPLTVIVP